MLKYQITIGTNTWIPLSLQSSCTAYDIESSETSHIAPEKDDCHFLYHFTPPKQRDLLLHQCTCQSKDWSETSRKKTRERERERESVCVCEGTLRYPVPTRHRCFGEPWSRGRVFKLLLWEYHQTLNLESTTPLPPPPSVTYFPLTFLLLLLLFFNSYWLRHHHYHGWSCPHLVYCTQKIPTQFLPSVSARSVRRRSSSSSHAEELRKALGVECLRQISSNSSTISSNFSPSISSSSFNFTASFTEFIIHWACDSRLVGVFMKMRF